MNTLKKIMAIGLFGLVGVSSCGPIYPVVGVGLDWQVEDNVDVVDTHHDFISDELTFKVSWDRYDDEDLAVTIRTPNGNDIFEGGPNDDGCYFDETYAQSATKMVSIIQCPDADYGTYEIFIENPSNDDANAKVEVTESYDNGRDIIQQTSIQNRQVNSFDNVKLTYDF